MKARSRPEADAPLPRGGMVLLVDIETGERMTSGVFRLDRGGVEAQVLHVLKARYCRVVAVPYEGSAATASMLRALKPRVVFNLTEWIDGDRARDHEIASMLERTGARYTGTGPQGLRLCRDKVKVNRIVADLNIDVPRNFVIRSGDRVSDSRIGYPLFVKPAQGDGSDHIGLNALVNSRRELHERVRVLRARKAGAVLCEEYIAGRDLFVGLLGNKPRVLRPLELVVGRRGARAPRFATAALKHDESYKRRWKVSYGEARLPARVRKTIREASGRIFHALQLRDYARLDFRLTPDNRLVFIEANPNPDLGRHTFGRERCFAGVKYPDLINGIVRAVLRRGD